jgi:poly(beta-D-mannuronate) lyase
LAGDPQERPSGMPGWEGFYERHATQPVSAVPPPANNGDARMGGDRSLPNPLEHPRRG